MQSRQKPSHGSKAEKNRMASWLWVGFSIRRTCQVPLPMLAAWVSVSDVEPAADLIRQATCSTDVPSDWNRLHVSMQWKFMDTLREQNNFWCTVITISKCCNPKKIEKVRFTTTLQFRSGERERIRFDGVIQKWPSSLPAVFLKTGHTPKNHHSSAGKWYLNYMILGCLILRES